MNPYLLQALSGLGGIALGCVLLWWVIYPLLIPTHRPWPWRKK